jgi:hypothetical protein
MSSPTSKKVPKLEALFYLTAIFCSLLIYSGDEIAWHIPAIIFLLSALRLSIYILNQKYFYSGILLAFNSIFCGFVLWVVANQSNILFEPIFDFTVFRDQYLRKAAIVMTLATSTTWLTWRMIVYQGRLTRSANRLEVLQQSLNYFARFSFANGLALHCLSLIAIVYFASINTTILELPYPTNLGRHSISGEFLKIPVFLSFVAYLIIVTRDVRLGRTLTVIGPLNFLFILAVSMIYLFIVGSRGLCVFLWMTLGAINIYISSRARRKSITGPTFILFALWGYLVFPSLRAEIWSADGFTSLTYIFGIDVTFGEGGGNKSSLAEIPLLGQSLFHLLYVIDLIALGNSRDGLTFINLIPQIIPDFLDPSGSIRPINDNWLLSEYYFHGGGFLSIANAYWNGGLIFVALFCIILTGLCSVVDKWFISSRYGPVYTLIYYFWVPVFTIQLAYGIQGLSRVFQIIMFARIVGPFMMGIERRRPTEDLNT